MKKLLLGLMICLCLTSCDIDTTKDGINYYTDVKNIEGHKYIVARTYNLSSGGISIIHAESCECKNK